MLAWLIRCLATGTRISSHSRASINDRMTAIAARHSAWRPSRSEAIPCGDLLSTTVVMFKPPPWDRGSANDTALVSIWLCTRRPTLFCRYLSHERRIRRSHGTGAREPDDARNDRQCGLRAAASGCSTHDEGAVIGLGHMSVRDCPLALRTVTPLSRLMFTGRSIPPFRTGSHRGVVAMVVNRWPRLPPPWTRPPISASIRHLVRAPWGCRIGGPEVRSAAKRVGATNQLDPAADTVLGRYVG